MEGEMMDDDDGIEVEYVDPDMQDAIAARAFAYNAVYQSVSKERDKAMRKEGLMMLSSLRRSFKTTTTADVVAIAGGKTECSS
jgi:hypothetical protein